MANNVKDTHVEEKEELVVHGAVLADEFRNRQTGKVLGSDVVTEDELPTKIAEGIEQSLLNGELKTVLQNKTLSVADFPLTSDIDNQHSTVNEGLLPNGDMTELTESQINKLVLTLNRIINKGWLKVNTGRALKLASVLYNADYISIAATSIVFGDNAIVSGQSYLITLDIANASYDYSAETYNPEP